MTEPNHCLLSTSHLLRRFAVGFGRYADETFEELSEERNVWEVENLRDFLDISGRRAQKHFGIERDVFVNPTLGILAGLFFGNSREVLRRDAKFIGVEFYGMLFAMIFDNEIDKLRK